MQPLSKWFRPGLMAVIIVLLVWTTALADHASVTFSQFNNLAGGTAIEGIAVGGNDGTHAGVGVVGKSSAGVGIGVWGRATNPTGINRGVLGESESIDGCGLMGSATAASGTTYGVYGQSASTAGRGVYGTATASSGTTFGVYGQSASTAGRGVSGYATAASGTTYGVYGQSSSTDGRGVYGTATASSGATSGVYGESSSTSGRGVFGYAATGVLGRSDSPTGYGLSGIATNLSTNAVGVGVDAVSLSPKGVAVYAVGYNGALAGWFGGNVTIAGDLTVTGVKSFVQPHPTQRNKEIVYIALEGPEAGTYIRGTARLVRGQAIITLPGHFALVTADQGLTVQLTPMGGWLQLYVQSKSLRRIIVREAQGKTGQFDYVVQGVRRGFEHHQVIRNKILPVAAAPRGR